MRTTSALPFVAMISWLPAACSSAPEPASTAGTAGASGTTAVAGAGVCLDWDACTKNPVRFCISSQITYDGLTHGWPQIGGTLISDFQGTIE